MIEVFFDGLCQPVNPGGIACYALVVKRDGEIVHSAYGVAGEPFSKDSTNNVAEYTALAKALEWLIASKLNHEKLVLKSDSQLVVRQLAGEYKIKSKRIIPLYKQVLILRSKFQDVEIKWVPREQNKDADRLTNRAYSRVLQDNPEYFDKVAELG